LAVFVGDVRSPDELLSLIEYERWRQTKLEAEISSYQCRLLRLAELLHHDSSTSSVSSLTSLSSSQVNPPSTPSRQPAALKHWLANAVSK